MDELTIDRARGFLQRADLLLDSSSAIDKLDLHEALNKEWQGWHCDDRKAVGRALEQHNNYVKKIMEPFPDLGQPTQITFDYKDGRIPHLTIERPNNSNAGRIRIVDPFKGCG